MKLELTLQDIYVIASTLEESLAFANWRGLDTNSRRSVWQKIVDSQIIVAESKESEVKP